MASEQMNSLRSGMNFRSYQVDRRFNNIYLLIGGSRVNIMAAILSLTIAVGL
jgi:hypothetical protein